ncbi:MAG: hypothetical protein E6R03_17320 [Hyphomicrobiaceae bacterium]|nr:MAG: hypothetical protein E6R03_17320 [Hyphomicrobiaceae bacterium]
MGVVDRRVLGSAQGTPCKKKGELDAALGEIASAKRTSHAFIADTLRARRYNRLLGFSVFTPWTVNEIDQETADALDAIDELDKDQADFAKAKQDFENVLAKRRAASGYRSYARR